MLQRGVAQAAESFTVFVNILNPLFILRSFCLNPLGAQFASEKLVTLNSENTVSVLDEKNSFVFLL